MNLRRFAMTTALGGSSLALAQGGFIVHFDTLQAGRNGRAVSVREFSGRYLVFTDQFSQEFPGIGHIYIRRLGLEGTFEQEHEFVSGLERDFDIGYIDAVTNGANGDLVAIIAEGRDFSSRKMFYRFGADGDTLSTRLIMTYPPEDSISQAIRQIRSVSSGYAFCGFHDRPQEVTKALLGKLNHEGDTLWLREYGGANEAPVALGVAEYTDGGFLLTGYSTNVLNRSFLIRTDAQGNQLWRRNYGNRAAAVNGAVRVAADGGIITWSEYRDPAWPNDWQQMMLTKWNASGGIVWQKRSHYNLVSATYDFEILPDGSMIASGTSLLNGVLAKFSSEGDSLWSRTYAFTHDYHLLYDVQPTSDGGFVATGTAYRYAPLDPEFQTNQLIWVVKTDSLGCVVPGCHQVGVQEYALDLNEHLRVWPNPVGGQLWFSFAPPPELVPQGPLRAVLLDAQGRTVLEESFPGAMGHREQREAVPLSLSTISLPCGTYHLHLSDGRRWLAGKTIVKE